MSAPNDPRARIDALYRDALDQPEAQRESFPQARCGGRRRRETLAGAHLQLGDVVDVVALDEAMAALASLPNTGGRLAAVVELRVFGAMTVADCARTRVVSARTIDQDWSPARAFLRKLLSP